MKKYLLIIMILGLSLVGCEKKEDGTGVSNSKTDFEKLDPPPALELPSDPFHQAVIKENIKEIREFIQKGVDVNKLDRNYGCTALHIAAGTGNLEIVKILRKAGARIYVENKKKEPLVFAAVISGNVKVLDFLIKEGASIKSRSTDGDNMLHLAITFHYKDIVIYLIGIGVDVNAKNKKGWTPLHEDACVSDIRVTNELVKAGAAINAVTYHKKTPLHIAASYNNSQAVEDLLSNKADCKLLDESGRTPLFMTNSVKIIRLLLKAGTNPNITDRYKYSPLSGAVVARNGKERVLLLIQGGADVNMRIDHGRTAIFNVIPNDNVEVFALLVENGADLSIKSDSGKTPLDWIKEYNARKIKAFLEKYKKGQNEKP